MRPLASVVALGAVALFSEVWAQPLRPMHGEDDPYAATSVGRMCCSRRDCRPVAPGELRFHVREDGEPGWLFTDRQWDTGIADEFVTMERGDRVLDYGLWQHTGATEEDLPGLTGAHVCLMRSRIPEFSNPTSDRGRWYVRCLFMSEEGS